MSEAIRITEIYKSIQGESLYAGFPCVFIRVSGCPLRCRWCDTVYSFKEGDGMSLGEIVEKTCSYETDMVELTGGEPLAQKETIQLAKLLVEKGKKLLIETGGSESISDLPPETHVILDLKPPGSGMTDRMKWENIKLLKSSDEIKFVVANREDFEWSIEIVKKYDLENICTLNLSPAFGLVKPEDLVNWQLESGINFRLNMQLHKYIWHPRKKGV